VVGAFVIMIVAAKYRDQQVVNHDILMVMRRQLEQVAGYLEG
jgi:hypothetical protein